MKSVHLNDTRMELTLVEESVWLVEQRAAAVSGGERSILRPKRSPA